MFGVGEQMGTALFNLLMTTVKDFSNYLSQIIGGSLKRRRRMEDCQATLAIKERAHISSHCVLWHINFMICPAQCSSSCFSPPRCILFVPSCTPFCPLRWIHFLLYCHFCWKNLPRCFLTPKLLILSCCSLSNKYHNIIYNTTSVEHVLCPETVVVASYVLCLIVIKTNKVGTIIFKDKQCGAQGAFVKCLRSHTWWLVKIWVQICWALENILFHFTRLPFALVLHIVIFLTCLYHFPGYEFFQAGIGLYLCLSNTKYNAYSVFNKCLIIHEWKNEWIHEWIIEFPWWA